MSDDFQQRGGSPWGTPPGGGNGNGSGRGPTPPDIDKIIREFQEKIKKFLPGGSSSGGKKLIEISDAAKAIGHSSNGPLTALVWWFHAR